MCQCTGSFFLLHTHARYPNRTNAKKLSLVLGEKQNLNCNLSHLHLPAFYFHSSLFFHLLLHRPLHFCINSFKHWHPHTKKVLLASVIHCNFLARFNALKELVFREIWLPCFFSSSSYFPPCVFTVRPIVPLNQMCFTINVDK